MYFHHTHTPTPTHPLNLNVILLQVTCHKTGHISPSDPCIWPDLWRKMETFVSKIRPLIPNLQDGLRNVFVTFPSIDAGTPSPITSSIISEALQRVWGNKITATRLNDWLDFYAVSAIFQPCNGVNYLLNVISSEIVKFPWRPSRAYSSSKSSETVICVPKGLLSLTRGTI